MAKAHTVTVCGECLQMRYIYIGDEMCRPCLKTFMLPIERQRIKLAICIFVEMCPRMKNYLQRVVANGDYKAMERELDRAMFVLTKSSSVVGDDVLRVIRNEYINLV